MGAAHVMSVRSLKLRLLGAGVVSIVVALAIAGVGLQLLFERHVERRFTQELESDLRQLVSAIVIAPDGQLQIALPLPDPRFSEPMSGLYWQVSPSSGGPALR